MPSRERVEFDVVGKDSGGSAAFRAVGDAAGKAADQIDDAGKQAAAAGEQIEELGDKADRSGDQAEDAGEQYRGLAADIAAAQAAAAALAQEINKTGNLDLVKDLDRQRREIRKLTRVQDLLPDGDDMGGQLAEQVSVTFVQRLGPLIARVPMASMNPAALAIGAPLAAGAATLVGTAVAGAVIGAVGVGGVVGGLKLAAKDPRVQAAGKELGQDVSEVMGRASAAFVPETLDAIDTIRGRVQTLEPQFERTFSAAARYVDPLLDGLLDAGENALPGVTDAMEHAGPVIDSVAQGLRDIGTEVSESLSELAPYADEGARALDLLFDTVEVGVESTTALLTGLGELYGWSERLAALWTGGGVPALAGLAAEQYNAEESARRLADGEREVGQAAAAAVPKVESLTDAIFDLAGNNITAEEAQSRLEEAIDRVTGAAVNQGAGIDRSTAKGKENRDALVALARASNTAAEAVLEQTGSHELAADAAGRGRKAFLEAARAMGVEKGQAAALADQLFAIPNIKRTVTIQERQAMDAIRRVQAGLGRINSKDIHIGVYWKSNGDLKLPGGTSLRGLSEGGAVTGPGPKGVDTEPRMLAVGEHVWTDEEVDAVGGHQAMEQLRAMVRGEAPAQQIATTAARRPAVAAGGGIDYDRLAHANARALAGMTLVLDDRTGRTATLMARGA